MPTKSSIVLLFIGASLLSGCSANKKLKTANSQISSLQAENSQLTGDVNNLKKQVADLSSQNTTLNEQFTSYKKQCQANEVELMELTKVKDEFRENVKQLENRLNTALADFESHGLDVFSKDGVIYVDMEDNLLYKSGSATLSTEGKKALSQLATVLNEYPKLKVTVVGNTDTLHVKGVKDNWSLSTERANGVVRILQKDYQVDPSRLTAAGTGKFNPIADNSTAEGRAKNRRTEIVLNPDWERLWQSGKKE